MVIHPRQAPRTRPVTLFVKEGKVFLGEGLELRRRNFHADDFRVTEVAIVRRAGHIMIADFLRRDGASRVARKGGEIVHSPLQDLVLCDCELVLHVPEAATTKIDLRHRLICRSCGLHVLCQATEGHGFGGPCQEVSSQLIGTHASDRQQDQEGSEQASACHGASQDALRSLRCVAR